MAPQCPRIFHRIRARSPAELSQYKRLSRCPRKLATKKCDTCRQAKQKCIPDRHGCQRCSERKLGCPGLTKANRTKPQPPVLIETLLSSTVTITSITGSPLEAPEWTQRFHSDKYGSHWMFLPEVISVTSSCGPCLPDTESEASDALDELQGLEIGLDFLDELKDEDEAVDDGEKTMAVDEEVSTSVIIWYTYDDPWPTIDDDDSMPGLFTLYLRALQPTTLGNVECLLCDKSFARDFDFDYAWNHFRYCWYKHKSSSIDLGFLIPLCWHLPYVWKESEKIEQHELIDRLRGKCPDMREKVRISAQAKLPSPIVFLTQLRPFCDGQLTCIGPKCKGIRFFDASWDHLKSHYENYHTDYYLQDEDIEDPLDIDIHLAREKRDFERLFAKARICREEWASMDGDKRKTEYLHCTHSLECECSVHRRLPTMLQFKVLEDLNGAFRSRYQQFCQHAAKSDSKDMTAFIGELRLECPRPRDLRRLGTRIFKQVIQGTSPTTLLEIFAFISLSQAMANVMSRRDIHIDLDPGTIDYLSWRTLIEDEASQRLYDEILIAWFHPRWKDELHYDRSHQTPLSVQQEMHKLVLQLVKAKQTNGAFKFSAFLRLDPFSQKQAPQESTFALLDDDCEPSGSPADTNPNKEENDDPGGSDTKALTNTVIFVRVWLFMIFIAALGVALLYLSNPEQRCHIRSAEDEEHVASVYDIVLVIETLKKRILNHLRQDSETPAPDEIITAAEEVLDGGYIWSVTDFHIHLQKAVLNHVEQPGLRSLLSTEITRLCRDAFNSIQSICENHGGECMFAAVPGWSPSIFPSHVGLQD